MKRLAFLLLMLTVAMAGCGQRPSTSVQGGPPASRVSASPDRAVAPAANQDPAGSVRLRLRPGMPGTGAPAADIPPGEITWDLPLYPGAGMIAAAKPLPMSMRASPYLKAATAQYLLPTTPPQAMQWYRRHLAAPDYRVVSEGTSEGLGLTTAWSITFSPAADPSRWIELTFQPAGPVETLVQYAASAIDAPPRPAGSYLPAGIARVEVTYRPWRPDPPTQHRVLTDSRSIAELVAAVNAMPRDTRGVHGCAADFGQGAQLLFALADGGSRQVSLRPACQSAVVAGYPPLQGNQAWDKLVAIMAS